MTSPFRKCLLGPSLAGLWATGTPLSIYSRMVMSKIHPLMPPTKCWVVVLLWISNFMNFQMIKCLGGKAQFPFISNTWADPALLESGSFVPCRCVELLTEDDFPTQEEKSGCSNWSPDISDRLAAHIGHESSQVQIWCKTCRPCAARQSICVLKAMRFVDCVQWTNSWNCKIPTDMFYCGDIMNCLLFTGTQFRCLLFWHLGN